jgi:predicted alpha/beta superfamily hydrolase
MPVINTTLNNRIKGDKWNIGGSSLGGLISCYAIHTRPLIY